MRNSPNKYGPNDKVKSCYKLESGLRLGQEGLHACQMGPFSSPIFYTPEEASKRKITKPDLIEKRRYIFDLLNTPGAETPCRHCDMVTEKTFSEVRFDQLGHIDLAATTSCNLRCHFCGYTQQDSFAEARYDALPILQEFTPDDVVWSAAVDFNGGEPTLLKDFDEYISYFESRKIRVFLFSNGLVYKPSVYNALVDGTIRWACISLDAGTSTTYEKTKKSSKFHHVLENIGRYAEAGSQGGGNVSVKYIFTEQNLGDDDLFGFVFAMLALRPQEVWLTFDFDPLCNLPANEPNFGGYNYGPHIKAYAKMFRTFEQYGIRAIHYIEKHLAPASLHGKRLMDLVGIELEQTREISLPEIHLRDFRKINISTQRVELVEIVISQGKAYKIDCDNILEEIDLSSLPLLLAPTPLDTKDYLSRIAKAGINPYGLLDRDKVLQGKFIGNLMITSYRDAKIQDNRYYLVRCKNEILNEVVKSISEINGNAIIYIDKTEYYSATNKPLAKQIWLTPSS